MLQMGHTKLDHQGAIKFWAKEGNGNVIFGDKYKLQRSSNFHLRGKDIDWRREGCIPGPACHSRIPAMCS